MKVIFERDSVCAGDDVFAPNSIEYSFEQSPLLCTVLDQTVVGKYLPSVSGAKTYWTAMCGRVEIAEIEHLGSPYMQANIRYLSQGGPKIEKVFFRYERQEPLLD